MGNSEHNWTMGWQWVRRTIILFVFRLTSKCAQTISTDACQSAIHTTKHRHMSNLTKTIEITIRRLTALFTNTHQFAGRGLHFGGSVWLVTFGLTFAL